MVDATMAPVAAKDDTSIVQDFLIRAGLAKASESLRLSPLAGGVSSDIWRIDLPGRSVCVKRALPQLRVAADWCAPVSRNAYEWAWIKFAAGICPGNVPLPLAQDADVGLFAMSFLDPVDHPVWKVQLLQGTVSVDTARQVGQVLGRLHAASALNERIALEFDSGPNFYALRLEPYLVECSRKHPRVASQLLALVERTSHTRRALIHGDVSPKNILIGAQGPILLDAECAWYGDPAFDLAFCLNHLLLKALAVPQAGQKLRKAFDACAESYFDNVNWEDCRALESRMASLLPALLLARVDGKSPVEYLRGERDVEGTRAIAFALIEKEPALLDEVAEHWFAFASSH